MPFRIMRDLFGCSSEPRQLSDETNNKYLITGFMKKITCTLFALAIVLIKAGAQTYSIDRFKVPGGGGTSTGGVFTLSGTIGQHDVGGPLSGGNFSLTGGF